MAKFTDQQIDQVLREHKECELKKGCGLKDGVTKEQFCNIFTQLSGIKSAKYFDQIDLDSPGNFKISEKLGQMIPANYKCEEDMFKKLGVETYTRIDEDGDLVFSRAIGDFTRDQQSKLDTLEDQHNELRQLECFNSCPGVNLSGMSSDSEVYFSDL